LPGTSLSPDVQAFFHAIVWGERSGLSIRLKDAFVDTGLAHVLAISGLHMGIVAWSFYKLMLFLLCTFPRMRDIGQPARWAAFATLWMVWLFVGVIIASPATLRAAVVITFFLLGTLLGRRSEPLRTLAWAATILLVSQPSLVFSVSFQLSFSAASGIVLAHRSLRRFIRDYEERTWVSLGGLRRSILSLMTLNTAAWSVTTPLCLASFGQASVAGLAINLGLLPIASMLVIPWAFLYASLIQLFPDWAWGLSGITEFILGGFLDLVDGWAEILPSSQGKALEHGAGLALTLTVLWNLNRLGRIQFAAFVMVVLGVVLVPSIGSSAMRISMLDVGHGDAAVVQTPEGGTIVIDSGGSGHHPTRNIALANRTVIPSLARLGVDSIELAMITHSHADHMGAFERLAERIPIRELWIGPCGTEHPILRRIAARVASRGGSVKVVTRGTSIEWTGIRLQVLWPPKNSKRPNGSCRFGLNDASLVVRLTHADKRVLFVGDLEEAGEEGLMRLEDDLQASILKIGHHGSRTSTSKRFLDAVNPSFGLMSGVLSPGRMPPHADVIERLQHAGVRTWITDRDGAITLDIHPYGPIVPTPYPSKRTLRSGGSPVDTKPSW